MQFVEIYKLKNDGSQEIIATCELIQNTVVCKGDKTMIQSLEKEGIRDFSASEPKKLFPKDGLRFLEQLKYNFKSGYLMASDIKER